MTSGGSREKQSPRRDPHRSSSGWTQRSDRHSSFETQRSRSPRCLTWPQNEVLVGRLPWDLVSWRGNPRSPRCPMSRHRKDPLRPLTADERQELTRLSRSLSAPAAQVERARALLAIADGASYTAAAPPVGRRHAETISAWVSRFNRDGLAAVRPGHGGGPRIRYGAEA